MRDAVSLIGRCRAVLVVLAATLLLGATGCGDDSGAGTTDSVGREPAVQRIVVTRDRGQSQPTCGPREVGQRLRGYASALATVDADALRDYWGRGFMWFRVLEARGGFEAEDYEAGVAALKERGGVRLRFREIEVYGDGGAVFDGTFWREIEGRSNRKRIAAKVELSCSRPTIIALSASGKARNVASCPDAGRRMRPRPTVVCSFKHR